MSCNVEKNVIINSQRAYLLSHFTFNEVMNEEKDGGKIYSTLGSVNRKDPRKNSRDRD